MKESAALAGVTTKPQFENYYRWVEPDTNITVCLKLETVDRLQLEVLRGIDSFSHAATEVGGILLGRTELDEGRILMFVDDFEPIPNEHRTGALYALTGRNAVHFETALAHDSARQARSVVGYYRSHNRDGLFLSKDDLWFIQRHFRRPDNLFLLIKTLRNRACTAGFFFWKDGHIQSEFTDSEAPLIPISVSSPGPSLSLSKPLDDAPGTLAMRAVLARVPKHNVPPHNLTVVSPPASSAAPAARSAVTVAEEGSDRSVSKAAEIETSAKADRRPDDEPETPPAIKAAGFDIAVAGANGPPPPRFGVRGRSREPETQQQYPQDTVRTPSVQPASKGEFLERTRRGTRWFRLNSLRSDSDRRHARRESGDGLIAFYWDGGIPQGHRVRDISLRGAYVETDFSWMCGTLMVLTLQIRSNGEPGNDTIVVPAKIVRTSPEGMGLKFLLPVVSDLCGLFQFLSRWNPNSAQLLLGERERYQVARQFKV